MPLLKPDLRASLLENLGDELDAFAGALVEPAPVSVRLNPAKPSDVPGEVVPWCPNGRYLRERPLFTLDPLLHAGAYYVQEASSMILEPVFGATKLTGEDILALDLCAAPGGKSTHLRSLLSKGSLLVSNEIDPKRASVLQENLWKWGHQDVVVCNNRPEHFTPLQGLFDLILVDAPCSGEGLIRKDPYAVEQWSPALVRECTLRQQRIIDAVWPALRPGGFLIYSTCTYEGCENEQQIERTMSIHDAEHVVVSGLERSGIIRGRNGIGLRCLPHRVKGEGLFMALLRKRGERNERKPTRPKRSVAPIDDKLSSILIGADDLDFDVRRDLLFATSNKHADALGELIRVLDPISPGIPVAEFNGTIWKPHAALALSSLLDRGAIAHLHVERERALQYLRGEAIRAEGATGIALVMFQSVPLGWCKGAGNRWNNRWPDPWRIRMR